MAAEQGDGFNLDDRDRLPWLEPAEDYEAAEPVQAQKVVALVLLGLALIGLIVGGGWWLKSRSQSNADGEVLLIQAPAGPYKIKAPDPKAREFAGEGDESYAASEGGETLGRIDASKAPEEPMTEERAAPAQTKPTLPRPVTARPTTKSEASAAIRDGARAKASLPAKAAPMAAEVAQATPTGGARIQLGAYNSDAIAQAAWARLVERFEELGTAGHAIEPVTANGKTLFRLRMTAAGSSEANALCGKLRVAGERCWIVP